MKRRTFLATAATAGLATSSFMPATQAAEKSAGREFYELRVYTVTDDTQRKLVENYLQSAFIPAMNRLGSRPVGVFTEAKPNSPIYVIVPHASLEAFQSAPDRLLADAEHNRAGAAYLNIEAPAKAYDRIESSLLGSISGLSKLVPPKQAGKAHLVQLRIYESHSEVAAKKKVEMFNEGELAIFQRVGLTPVLFGESLVGSRRPNLTYLLVFDDKAALDAAWGRFRTDPEWAKLKAIPEFADKKIVSKITNLILNATPWSQI